MRHSDVLLDCAAKEWEELRWLSGAPEVRPIEPIVVVPPPPAFAVGQPLPPPLVTYTPRPPAFGGLSVVDFQGLPPVMACASGV